MEQKILKSTKKLLNIGPDDPSFDPDIMTFINGAFSDLHDLGIEVPFLEDDSLQWDDVSDDEAELARIKTFVFLKVRMLFDPPQTSFTIAAMEKQIAEATWRLSVGRESKAYVDPEPTVVVIVDE